jgi:hypothetical protein
MAERKIDGRLADYPDHYLHCREVNHPWTKVGSYRHREKQSNYIISHFECPSCGMVREDWRQPADYSLVHRQYDRPDGYQFSYTESERDDGFRLRSQDFARVAAQRDSVFPSFEAFRQSKRAARVKKPAEE